MKVKFMDLVEVADDDVKRWFEHCETERDCKELARVMMESVSFESEIRAEILASRDSSGGGEAEDWG